MSELRIAVVQAAPVLFDLSATLAKIEHLTEEAATGGAKLILFPESFIPAYPRGMGFGTLVGSRSAKGRAQYQLYWQNAISVPGKEVDRLGELAKKHEVYLVMGVTEHDPTGTTLYCSILYFSPEGKLIGHHRKLKPTGSERIIWGEGDGKDLQVMDTSIGRIGGLICWENYMPLARMALYQQGIQIYLAPTADARDIWQKSLQTFAYEGRCFLLGCNQFVTKEMYPESLQEELANQEEIMCRGGSTIISPMGEVIAGPLYGKEGILFGDLDLDDIIRAKMDFDVSGHYHRPDVFAFHLKA